MDKLVPRAIAAAAVGYCVWPSLMTFFTKPDAKPPEKPPVLSATMLVPKLPPAPARNPFAEYVPAPVSTAKVIRAIANAALGKKGAAAAAAAAADVAAMVSPRSKSAAQRSAGITAKTTEKKEALKLEATCVVGDRRLAVINGRVYAVRDAVAAPGAFAASCVVADVQPYKVLLQRDGKNIELTYPDAAVKSGSGREKSAAGKSASKRAAPAKSKNPK